MDVGDVKYDVHNTRPHLGNGGSGGGGSDGSGGGLALPPLEPPLYRYSPYWDL